MAYLDEAGLLHVAERIKEETGRLVPSTRTVNEKSLAADITLSYTDVNSAPATHADQHAITGTDPLTPESIGAAKTEALTAHTGDTGNPHGVTAAQVGIRTITITLTTTWTGAGPYTQTVPATGITPDSHIVVSPQPVSLDAYAAAGVRCTTKGDGVLTFSATKLPDAALAVDILIVG